jgi:hypothetical protein
LQTVKRQGGATLEYLVQHGLLRTYDANGVAQTAVVLRDPLPLTHGKTAWAVFAAGIAFVPTLRQLDHAGIAVQHYVLNRALHGALVRHFAQHHALLAKEQAPASSAHQCGQLQWLLEWLVDTGCSAHDVHRGLTWGLHMYRQDLTLLKDVYVGIDSLRSSYDIILGALPLWSHRKCQVCG